MEKFKGTPGPWARESAGRGIGPVSEDDDQSYGMVITVAYVDFGESDEVQNSNAQLIAAAPELLEACMRMRNQLYAAGYEAERGSLNPTKCLLNQIESAINKALGEKQ